MSRHWLARQANDQRKRHVLSRIPLYPPPPPLLAPNASAISMDDSKSPCANAVLYAASFFTVKHIFIQYTLYMYAAVVHVRY